MNADDDPEARIRELERPLSDFARAAELTASSAGAESQAPPGRGAAVVVRAMAAVFVMVGAAVVFLISRGPTTTPGAPSLPSTATPTPPRSVVAAPSPARPAHDPSVTITITGARENKTLVCAGNRVLVSGASNSVTLTGACAGLTVSGIGNVITVDSTPTILVSGLNNRVTYRSGNPEVSTSGLDNIVGRG